ncbi:MAG: inorganic phosphate transporter [Pseudaminobacter sp.]
MGDQARSKHTLDKDLGRLAQIEEASGFVARGLMAPGVALLFLILAALAASLYVFGEPHALFIVIAAAIAAYLAMNIGANDVANNVGPAVGAKAMTMVGALILAAIFEAVGALVAGDTVVVTISAEIIEPSAISQPGVMARLMLAGLISSALWINFSTWIGAPISTTHSIVGGVIGAGAAAAGLGAVNWTSVAMIATSWLATPFLGAAVAIIFLAFVKTAIIYQDDKIAAARRWVPVLVALMSGCFATYLVVKLFPGAGGPTALLVGGGCFALAWVASRRSIMRQSQDMENRNRSLRRLFRMPLIGSAALLSFAHGANDVANAVGPLAAIVHAARSGEAAAIVDIPLWVMAIGAFGISCGLLLYGPKLVRIVGGEITKLNPMRAFCVALAVAIIVIAASWFGMPVSSTHTAVGAVFGVGFFREWYIANSTHRQAYLQRKRQAAARNARESSQDDDEEDAEDDGHPQSRVSAKELERRRLVRRAHIITILAAWATTVPAAGLLAALLFMGLEAIS